MELDDDVCYRALCARDARFDGRFFVAVETTGIYCRPICPARTPGRARCAFFRYAAQAEKAGYRACFRCRPEVAPADRATASVDALHTLVAQASEAIERGALNGSSVHELARRLGVTDRHLRRAMVKVMGVTPHELARSRRLQIAKQLLVDSTLPITQVAFAAGFRSVRRFNATFSERFGMTPTAMRRGRSTSGASEAVTLTLAARAPFSFEALLGFWRPRAIAGVAEVVDGRYRRTLRVGDDVGSLWIEPARGGVRVGLSASLANRVPLLSAEARRALDLDAHPAAINAVLAADPMLAHSVAEAPGMRLPGAFDPFELALRTVVGQQVSVAAASTLAARIAARFGEPVVTPWPSLHTLSPTAACIANLSEPILSGIGMPTSRARTLIAVARGMCEGRLRLGEGFEREAWLAVPGVGPWTADYLAMRGARDPDAFLASDLVLRRRTNLSAAELAGRAEAWRPFRAYAALHLWRTS